MTNVSRREFLNRAAMAAAGLGSAAALSRLGPVFAAADSRQRPPNIIVIFADDLGYGDLGCFGHPTIRTPNLDRMAAGGARMTQFYSAASVCTPSRAALLTGRLPIRSGMCSDKRRVLFPNSGGGIQDSEVTIPEALREQGYATACVGKWHLGHLPQFLPTRHGFDHYYGIPYSNDMKPCPLMEDEEVVEEPADQTTLTRRYTERALRFIRANRGRPFFLYFPHTFPHVPLFASRQFKDTSTRGLYGDVVEELDWSVGQILDVLHRRGIAENTLVVFTSDNEPWLTRKLNGGSAGLLRGGKGSTWEGGMREPFVAYWPGTIPAGTVRQDLTCTMDIFTTCLTLAGAEPPADRVIDGVNLMPALTGEGRVDRDTMFFYRGAQLYAVRKGPWKGHFITQGGYGQKPTKHDAPQLFHLEHDPSEKHNVAEKHPDVIADLEQTVREHQATVKPVPSQLEVPLPANAGS